MKKANLFQYLRRYFHLIIKKSKFFKMNWKSTPAIFIISILTIFVIAKLLARLQKKRLRLAYSKRNPLMSDFVKKSRIATIQFEPFTFGITPIMQTIAYLLYELF